MIKANKGAIEINGTGKEILSELTVLLYNVRKVLCKGGATTEEADRLIDDCIKTSRASQEELMAEAKKLLKELLRDLFPEEGEEEPDAAD